MLKGSAHSLANFMAGTMVFMIAFIVIYLELTLPLGSLYVTKLVGEGDIRSMEFANMVRTYMIHRIGNGRGDISYTGLVEQASQNFAGLGIGENYVEVTDLKTGMKWEVTGSEERALRHDTFTTISSNFMPVSDESDVVMDAGGNYIIHVYKTGTYGNLAVDIYTERSCVPGGRTEDTYMSYMLMGCDELGNLQKIAGNLETIMQRIVSAYNLEGPPVSWVVPESDITAEDLIMPEMRFGRTEQCNDLRRYTICFRLMGDFITTARLRAEVGRGGAFVQPD